MICAAADDDPEPESPCPEEIIDGAEPDRVEVAEPAHPCCHRGEAQAAGQPQGHSLPLVGPAVVAPADDHRDPEHRHRDPHQCTAAGPFTQEEHPQGDHPEGRRVLQVNGIGGGRHLDRTQIRSRHRAENQAQRDHHRPEDPASRSDEGNQSGTGEETPKECNRQRVKRQRLGKHAAEAPEYASSQHTPASPACVPGQRGNLELLWLRGTLHALVPLLAPTRLVLPRRRATIVLDSGLRPKDAEGPRRFRGEWPPASNRMVRPPIARRPVLRLEERNEFSRLSATRALGLAARRLIGARWITTRSACCESIWARERAMMTISPLSPSGNV